MYYNKIKIKKNEVNEVKEKNYIPRKIRNSLHYIGLTVKIKIVYKYCGNRIPYIYNDEF